MGRIVFVVLLASCFATGLALRCYECISNNALPASLSASAPLPPSAHCPPSSFNGSAVSAGSPTGPDGTVGSSLLLGPAYCVRMVGDIGDLKGVTIRGALHRSELVGILGGDAPALPPHPGPSPLPPLVSLILMLAKDPLSRAEMRLCSTDLCN